MKDYVDYEFYKKEFNGHLDITSFRSSLREACLIVDRNVNRKLEPCFVTDRVKYVVCRLIDLVNKKSQDLFNSGNNISSVSIDGVSKTYKTPTAKEIEDSFDKQVKVELNSLPQELTRYL